MPWCCCVISKNHFIGASLNKRWYCYRHKVFFFLCNSSFIFQFSPHLRALFIKPASVFARRYAMHIYFFPHIFFCISTMGIDISSNVANPSKCATLMWWRDRIYLGPHNFVIIFFLNNWRCLHMKLWRCIIPCLCMQMNGTNYQPNMNCIYSAKLFFTSCFMHSCRIFLFPFSRYFFTSILNPFRLRQHNHILITTL